MSTCAGREVKLGPCTQSDAGNGNRDVIGSDVSTNSSEDMWRLSTMN